MVTAEAPAGKMACAQAPGRRGVYGALDLGTNNCRLLIARPVRSGFKVIDSFSRIVRLGEGVASSGHLLEAAVERTIEALKLCGAKMRRRGVTRKRIVATEACRIAANGGAFAERVEKETGLSLEIISRDEEAALTVAGCVPLLDGGARRALVFDIGGGSTELIWLAPNGAQAPRILAWTSIPYGVVQTAERHGGDRLSEATFGAIVDEIEAELKPFAEAQGAVNAHDVQMIGASGTVTTMAGVHLGLKRYDRTKVDGIDVTFEEINRVRDRLAGMRRHERARLPTIGPERADLVVAGAAILSAVMRVWPVGRMRVADRGVREGILSGLMAEDRAAPGHKATRAC